MWFSLFFFPFSFFLFDNVSFDGPSTATLMALANLIRLTVCGLCPPPPRSRVAGLDENETSSTRIARKIKRSVSRRRHVVRRVTRSPRVRLDLLPARDLGPRSID